MPTMPETPSRLPATAPTPRMDDDETQAPRTPVRRPDGGGRPVAAGTGVGGRRGAGTGRGQHLVVPGRRAPPGRRPQRALVYLPSRQPRQEVVGDAQRGCLVP